MAQSKVNKFKLGTRSLMNLQGVNKDLVEVVKLAIQITEQDFTVIEGLRDIKRQEKLFKSGASKTMNSRHLTGEAVDIAPWVNGSISWDWKYYPEVVNSMQEAAKELGVPLTSGAHWSGFPDGPHHEITWPHKR